MRGVNRQTRIVVTLAAVAAAGVGGLLVLSSQYRKRLDASPVAGAQGEAGARAPRLVDGFIAGRLAVKKVIERYPKKMKQLNAIATGDFSEVQGQRMGSNVDAAGAYRVERYNALTAHGMTFEDYATVRTAWRSWKDGKQVEDADLVAAFEAKRKELDGAALGEFEAFDDLIK